MSWLLRTRFRDYHILDDIEARDGTPVREFFNVESARRYLRTFQDDYFAVSCLRHLAAEQCRYSDVCHCSNQKIFDMMAWQLVSGQLKIADQPVQRPRAGGTRRPQPAPQEVEELPPARQPEIPVEMPQLALSCEIEETPQIELTVEIM